MPPRPASVAQLQRSQYAAQKRATTRDQRQAMLLGRLRGVRVPMMPGAVVKDPLPGMQAPVAAAPAEGVIYSDGPMDRFTGAHESAHLLERLMTDRDKARFMRVMGQPRGQWEVGTSGAMGPESTGYRNSGGERFADLAAMLAVDHDPRGNRVIGGYLDTADMPSRRRLLRFGRSLERFGARHDLPEYVRPRR
jgi:hypothetical protein